MCSTYSGASSTPHEEGGIFQLTTHPHVISYRSRMWILEELIRHAKAKGKVWCGTHRRGRALGQEERVFRAVALWGRRVFTRCSI